MYKMRRLILLAVLATGLCAACTDHEPAATALPPQTRADSVAAGLITVPLTADSAWAGEDEYTF